MVLFDPGIERFLEWEMLLLARALRRCGFGGRSRMRVRVVGGGGAEAIVG